MAGDVNDTDGTLLNSLSQTVLWLMHSATVVHNIQVRTNDCYIEMQ